MEKKGEKPMGKIILVTGMLGNNSRGVPSFILNTAYMNAIVAAGGVRGDDGKHKAGCGVRGNG